MSISNKLLNMSKRASRHVISIEHSGYETVKIVPDRTVSNKGGYVFALSLHEMYQHGLTRLHLGIKKRTYTPTTRIWYTIILKHDEFSIYISAKKGSEMDFVRQQLNRYWDKATFKDEIFQPISVTNTDAIQMKYSKHNIFGLKADYRMDETPISSLMNIVRELKKGEIAGISFCFEPYDRTSSIDHADLAMKQFKDGKMPKRGFLKSILDFSDIGDKGLHTLEDTVDAAMAGIEGGDTAKQKDRAITKPKRMDDAEKRKMLEDGKLERTTQHKSNQPWFKTWIRCFCHSEDQSKRNLITRSLSTTFSDLYGDNELVSSKCSAKTTIEEINEFKLNPVNAFDLSVNMMSAEEIGKFFQVPTANLQDEYRDYLDSVSNRETEIPEWLTDKGIPLGTITYRGKKMNTFVPVVDGDILSMPHFCFGQMRVGKTSGFGANMALGYIQNGYSAFFIDVTDGEIIRSLTNAMPDWMPDDHIIYLDFSHPRYAIPLSWSDVTNTVSGNIDFNGSNIDLDDLSDEEYDVFASQRSMANNVSDQLLMFLDRLNEDDKFSVKMGMYLKLAGQAVLSKKNATLFDVIALLTSKEFYKEKRKEILDKSIVKRLDEFWQEGNERTRERTIAPILTRLSVLTDNDKTMHSLFQREKMNEFGNPVVNFRRWADGDTHPYFVGIHVPKDYFLEKGTDMVVTYLINKLWLSVLSRADTPRSERRPCLMIMDEPHQFKSAMPLYNDMVRESAKWRLKLVWLGHTLMDFKGIQDTIKASGVQYTQYKSDSDESLRMMAHRMAPFTIEELRALPDKEWAVNKLNSPYPNEPAPAFLAHMAPRPPFVKDRSYLRDVWAGNLGQKRRDIDKQYFDWQTKYL